MDLFLLNSRKNIEFILFRLKKRSVVIDKIFTRIFQGKLDFKNLLFVTCLLLPHLQK